MVKPRDESVRARFATRVGPQFFCSRIGGFRQNHWDHRTHFVDRAFAERRGNFAASGRRHLHQSCGGRNATAHPASSARGKFATGSADCVQPRLLRHNPFVLHETPDRFRSLSWFACAARVSRRRRRPVAGVCAKPNSNWQVVRRKGPGDASAFRAGARPHGAGPTRALGCFAGARVVTMSAARFR